MSGDVQREDGQVTESEARWPYCWEGQPNPAGRGWCRCLKAPDHAGLHRCCGGSTGDVHEWEVTDG